MAMRRAAKRSSAKETPITGQYDRWVIAVVLMLLCIGLVMVLSASGVVAERINGDKYYFFKRQVLYACIGGVALWLTAAMPRDLLYKLQYPFLITTVALLILTLSPLGLKVNGAQRWLSLKIFSVQTLEFAKIALALYLAYFMSSKQDLVKTFSKGVIPPFAMTGFLCCLLLAQPDFGGAAVLAMILFFMCLVGGTRFVYLFLSIGMGLAGGIAMIIHSPYRAKRLTAFLDPFEDAQNAGYQLVQSLYALGSGGFFGVGMGGSAQKMFYLPEAHNDFIMSVVGEELGFFGITLIMVLFTMLFVRCYKIILGQSELRDRFSAFGITMVIALGAILNLAVVMGMVPPKGVAMPFLSYGGSSLLASMVCVGLLLNFSRTAR
ncbi:MAG: putative lipid II flippase FtsW [Bilophila sp.]